MMFLASLNTLVCCVESYAEQVESQPKLGELIRRLRLEKGLSQEALAEGADIHRNFLSEIERGNKGITLETLFRLSRALDTTPQSIITAIYEY